MGHEQKLLGAYITQPHNEAVAFNAVTQNFQGV